jgi:hypothetical protein
VAPNSRTSDPDIIAGELRRSIRKWRIPGSRVTRATRLSDADLDGSIESDLILLRANYDVARVPFSSHRPRLGRLIIVVKNAARELLVQLFDRQTSYNAAAARVLTRLDRKLNAILREQQRIERRLDALESRITETIPPTRIAPGDNAIESPDIFNSRQLNRRIDAIEEAIDGAPRGPRERA